MGNLYTNNKKPKIAIFTSAKRGLAHYTMHQWEFFNDKTKPYYITYTREEVDNFVKKVVKNENIKRLIDFSEPATSIIKVYNFCKKNNIDAALFQVSDRMRNNTLFFTSLIGMLKTRNITIGFILHEVLPYEYQYSNGDDLYLLYKLCDHFFVGNESEAYKLNEYFSRNKNTIHILKHGIYNLFDKGKYDKNRAKKQLNMTKENILLFFGQIRVHKKLFLLVDAVKKLLKSRNDFILYIISDLNMSSPQITAYLSNIKMKYNKNIKIIPHYLNTTQIEMYFKASDIVILPYEKVVQSGVLFLGVGFKRPILITDSFFEAEEFAKNKLGYVFKRNNLDDLVSKIDYIFSHKAKSLVMAKNAYNYYYNKQYWKKGVEKILKYLIKKTQ